MDLDHHPQQVCRHGKTASPPQAARESARFCCIADTLLESRLLRTQYISKQFLSAVREPWGSPPAATGPFRMVQGKVSGGASPGVETRTRPCPGGRWRWLSLPRPPPGWREDAHVSPAVPAPHGESWGLGWGRGRRTTGRRLLCQDGFCSGGRGPSYHSEGGCWAG
ncbi:unnamed protein product [Discosporangium mesarthrocarpum]